MMKLIVARPRSPTHSANGRTESQAIAPFMSTSAPAPVEQIARHFGHEGVAGPPPFLSADRPRRHHIEVPGKGEVARSPRGRCGWRTGFRPAPLLTAFRPFAAGEAVDGKAQRRQQWLRVHRTPRRLQGSRWALKSGALARSRTSLISAGLAVPAGQCKPP